MDLKTAKIIAGVGLVLGLLGFIPGAGWALGLVSLILFLVGISNISKIVGDPNVFSFFLIPVILWFISIGILPLVLGGSVFMILGGRIFSAGATVIAGTIVILALAIVAAVYYVKAYRLLAERLSVPVFNTVATLYKWGAILFVILVGAILIFVGNILAIVGFFTMPDQLQKTNNSQNSGPTT